jgi:hypothetical protein
MDLYSMPRIDAHPRVHGPSEAHRQLRATQAQLTEELTRVRQFIYATETDTAEAPATPRILREARQRAAQLEEELEEVRETLIRTMPELEQARSEARAALRPRLQEDAMAILHGMLEQAERQLESQQQLQELGKQAGRLGISLPLGFCVDVGLAGRIQSMQRAIERLYERTGFGAERGEE